MNKTLKKTVSALFCISCFAGIYAQELEPEEQLELEQLEEQAEEQKQILPPELQKNFIILEPVHPHELNPQITNYSSDSQILSGLYEGLFSYNPATLDPQYAIAKEFNISRDKKRWQITLREDAYFSNGEKIDAQAVRSSFIQMLSTPEAPYSSLLDIIRGAQDFRLGKGKEEDVGIYVTGENTISIYLNAPANYLPKILCHSAFSIIHRNPTVYSGAYELENMTENEYVLAKNPYYWDKEHVTLEKITFIQSDDKENNAFLFNTGAADWISSDVGTNTIINQKAIQINAEFGTGYLYFRVSPRYGKELGSSVWDLPEFRNAVLEAFPWNDLRAGSLVPAATLVYPLSGYPPVDGFLYTDAIEGALQMKDARAKYNIPEEQIIPLVMNVFENEFSDEQKTAMKNALAPLGVELQIQELPSAYYYYLINQSNADLFISSWIGDFADPLAFLELFRTGSTMNDSGWSSKEFDDLLEQAASVNDYDRYQLLGKAEDLLLSSGMVLPIYRTVTVNIINTEEVGGWASNAFDIHPLKYLYKRQVKSKLPNVVMK